MQETVATLPESVRSDLKEPKGPVFTDAADLLADVGGPLIAVGDVVTYHLERGGRRPDVAVVDGLTEREAVEESVATVLDDIGSDATVPNEAATLSAELVAALVAAIDRVAEGPTLISVEGEEDLAALPAIAAAPDGATVVYGQPGAGMVAVTVTPETRRGARERLRGFETSDRLWALLDRAE